MDTTPSQIQKYLDRFEGARVTPLILATTHGPLGLGTTAGSGAEAALINRTGRPILIDEIKIVCSIYDGTGGTELAHAQTDPQSPAAAPTSIPDDVYVLTESPLRALSVRFTLGGIALTRDFVPVSGMATGWDLRSSAFCVVWRPTVPIYIEDGEFLRPDLRYSNYAGPILGAGLTPNTAISPHVTYACRVLEDPQDWLHDGDARVLPYLTTFAPAALPMFAQNLVVSSDSDLMNPLDCDLFVDRLVGAVTSQIYDTLIGVLDQTTQLLAGASPGPLANIPERGIFVRMETSRGLTIIKHGAPFSHVFNAVDGVWWMNTKLGPREFFRVYLDVDFTDATAFMNDGSTVAPSITMHGCFFSTNFGQATSWHRQARDAEFLGQGQVIQVSNPTEGTIG